MSVDYDALFGIGFEVTAGDSLLEPEDCEDDFDDPLEDGLLEYIENEVDEEIADCFQPGNSFSGVEGDVYLVLKEPFKYGIDLTRAKAELEAEAKRLDVEVIGEFGIVGGLRIY